MATYKMKLIRNVNGRGNRGLVFDVTQEEQRDNYIAKGMAVCIDKEAVAPVDKMVRKSATKATPPILRTKRKSKPTPGGYGRGVPRRR